MDKYTWFVDEEVVNYGTSERSGELCDITRPAATNVRFSDGPHTCHNLSSNLTADRYLPRNKLEAVQIKTLGIIEHLIFRCVTLLLIITDLVVVVLDLTNVGNQFALEVISLTLSCYFMMEVLCRMFGKGLKRFLSSWIDMVDLIVVLSTFIFTVTYTVADLSKHAEDIEYTKLIVAGRLIRIILIVRFITERKHITKATRIIVSQNKRRYQMEGFDLDLCYITDNVIAMSFPSSGLMSLYRNPIKEVGRFLDKKHKNHYKVYNLCSERDYDEAVFHHRVKRISIDDHNVPKLSEMVEFCDDVRVWLSADAENVIAVHCRGGKGRTGVMLCAWLIESGLFDKAQASLDYFGSRRTDLTVGSKFQGVETPSQSRYVGYYELMKKTINGRLPQEQKLKLQSVKITGVGAGDGSDFSVEVICDSHIVMEAHFGSKFNCKTTHSSVDDSVEAVFVVSPVLVGDVKVRFSSTSADVPVRYDRCAFYFWFHTSFIKENRLVICRNELDNPHKEKTWSVFRENFAVHVQFVTCETKRS